MASCAGWVGRVVVVAGGRVVVVAGGVVVVVVVACGCVVVTAGDWVVVTAGSFVVVAPPDPSLPQAAMRAAATRMVNSQFRFTAPP